MDTAKLNGEVEASKTEKEGMLEARSTLARGEEDWATVKRLLQKKELLLEKERLDWSDVVAVFKYHAWAGGC